MSTARPATMDEKVTASILISRVLRAATTAHGLDWMLRMQTIAAKMTTLLNAWELSAVVEFFAACEVQEEVTR